MICCRNIIPSNIIREIDFKLFSKSISIFVKNSYIFMRSLYLCDDFKIDDCPLFCDRT